MVQRFDRDAARGRTEHRLRRRARYDPLPGHHRRLDRREGGLHREEHARRGPGHLQPVGHRTPRCRWTRRCSTRSGQDGGAVTAQDLKIQSPYNTYLNKGLTPTPICMPSPDALAAAVHPPPGGWLLLRAGAEGRHAGLLRHLRRAAGQRAAGEVPWAPLSRRRRPPHDGRRPARSPAPTSRSSASSGAPSPIRSRRCSTTARSPPSGLATRWRSFAFEVAPGQAPAALDGMRRAERRGPVGDHAAQGRRGRAGRRVQRRRTSPRRRQLRREPATAALYGTNTDGEGFVASLARGAGFDPAGRRCLVLGAGGAARAVVLALAEGGAAGVAS